MAKYSDNTVIEFVTVDPNNDFDKDSIEDSETEEPKLLPRLNKIRKIVRYQTVKRTGSRQSVHVKRFNRNKIDVSTMPVLRKKIQKVVHHRQTPAKNYDRIVRKEIDDNRPTTIVKRYKKNLIPMSEEKTLNLIYRIEQEACLWDRTRDDYRNKTLKDAAWNRIVRSTGIPIEIIKAKWSSLLGSYRHYRAKHMKGYAAALNWFAFDALSFMSTTAEMEYQLDETQVSCNSEPPVEEYKSEYLEEEYLSPSMASTPGQISPAEDDAGMDSPLANPSCNEEILRIVRSMSTVLNDMANIGMPVDYGRYVNQHLKEYDDEIRRKTVKGIMELIMSADEEMASKYPDRSTRQN